MNVCLAHTDGWTSVMGLMGGNPSRLKWRTPEDLVGEKLRVISREFPFFFKTIFVFSCFGWLYIFR